MPKKPKEETPPPPFDPGCLHPWLTDPWAALDAARRAGRLSHGLLISGPRGVGKADFGGWLAGALLCAEPDARGEPCGRCGECRLWLAGNHPDLLRVVPAEDKRVITVDQIRALTRDLSLKSHQGGRQVALLAPAEAMNANAANSLLKTLEEPTDNTILVLISEVPGRLPATIRSRCQQVRLTAPAGDWALAWLTEQGFGADDADRALAVAGGAPLAARALLAQGALAARRDYLDGLVRLARGEADPVSLAAGWYKEPGFPVLGWYLEWLQDMVRLRMGGPAPILRHVDLAETLAQLARPLDTTQLYRLLDDAVRAVALANEPVNPLAPQLLLEDQLAAWSQAHQAAAGRRQRAQA